jgi:protease PrsW
MILAFTAVSAIAPSLLLMWFFHARDVFREPPRVLWATFGLGVATIPGVLLVVVPFMALTGLGELSNPYLGGLSGAFLGAAIPEEVFKFLVVYFYAQRHHEFDEPMDGIVYGVAASLGFATLENVLYVAGGGLGVAVLRAFTAVPGHAFAGAIMGYYVGQAKFRPRDRGRLLAAAIFFPTLLHGLYDFPLLTMSAFSEASFVSSFDEGMTLPLLSLFLAALVVEAVWALRAAAGLRRQQLAAMTPAFAVAVAGAAPLTAPHVAPFSAFSNGAPPPAAVPAPRPIPPSPMAFPASPPFPGSPVAMAKAPSASSRLGGWLLLVLGAIPAAFGGLMVLGIGLAFALGDVPPDERVAVIGGGVLIGLAPLGLGLFLFAMGLRSLNRAGANVVVGPANVWQGPGR